MKRLLLLSVLMCLTVTSFAKDDQDDANDLLEGCWPLTTEEMQQCLSDCGEPSAPAYADCQANCEGLHQACQQQWDAPEPAQE